MSASNETRHRKQGRARGRSCLRRWRRDESGTTAVEMAIVAVPFFMLMFGIIQLGYRFFAAEALETATAEGARTIMTGQAQRNAGIGSASDFRDQVLCNPARRLVPDFMDCTKIVVDVRQLTAFSDPSFGASAADLLMGGGGTYSPGGRNAIVVARDAYPLPAVAPGLIPGAVQINGEMKLPLLSTFVFRNEPF